MSSSAPELSYPKCIKRDYFETILKKSEQDNSIIVDKFSVTMATKKGDNYASVMMRARVEYTSNKGGKTVKHLILKCAHEGEEDKEFVEDFNAFPREHKMLAEILPQIKQILKSVGDSTDMSASILDYVTDPTELMVLEDLAAKGYKLGNRQIGLDFNHCKAILSKVAKLHAGSLILREKIPSFVKSLGKPLMNPELKSAHDFMYANLKTLVNQVKTWPGYEKYVPKLENLRTTIIQKAIDACRIKNNEFAVLCHGDCSTSNMMFKYHNYGTVKEGILVDFQMSHWGPPSNDLFFFLFTSLSHETTLNHENELIQFYHEEFYHMLKKLNYEGFVPSLQKLHIQLMQNKAFGLAMALTVMPVTTADRSEENNVTPTALISETQEGDAIRNKFYSNPEVIKKLKTFLPYFDHFGLL